MKKYNPDAKCPKCGDDDISTYYEGRYERFTYKVRGLLARQCRRCHYTWDEEPLDVEEEQKEESK